MSKVTYSLRLIPCQLVQTDSHGNERVATIELEAAFVLHSICLDIAASPATPEMKRKRIDFLCELAFAMYED